ncbi:uncharacterized protein [Macrobrachium rosenbergii]|uniref:uncharacterized protein isoform X1 n=1 Tax=Macrobrachium rosenbergii TaxID=79674 RepID=UPI0034D79A35
MRPSLAFLLLSVLVSIATTAPSKKMADDLEENPEPPKESRTQPPQQPQEVHSRALRQVDKANGFSWIAIGVFGAFVKYMAYHFISKNSEGGEAKRSVEDTILDLSRISACLSSDPEGDVLSNFHLHCFFPSYFSRMDNDIISGVIWGSSQKEAVELSLIRRDDLKKWSRRPSREASEESEESRRLRDFPKAERKPSAGTGLSFLAVAIVGALAVYSALNRSSNEAKSEEEEAEGGVISRGLSSAAAGEYLRNANFILTCLQEEEFVRSMQCLLD